jgi:hypothetical protein
MGWSIGYDSNWQRDIGYGVPAVCDHPDCNAEINRGLPHVCGSNPYGGEHGCGLYFCRSHLAYHEIGGDMIQLCKRCAAGLEPFDPTPDTAEWTHHKATDLSWAERQEVQP